VLLSGQGQDASWESFLASGATVSDEELQRRLAQVGGDDPSDILFTSGTTGMPKGVMTAHAQNLRVFRYYSGTLGLREGDRFLIVNPFFNTFGYKAGWLSALMRGATVLPHAVFDAQAVLKRIERDRISVLPGPPTLYQTLLAMPALREFDLSSLRVAITGSASIPLELVERMHRELGFETVLTAYGMTETCGLVSMCTASDDLRTIAATSGRVIDGMQLRVIDDAGREVPAGTPGEILVTGYNLMQGYFQDLQETANIIDTDGWLHTGDIGEVDEGGYVRITGRKKEMFIVGGFSCYPAEIENILLTHPAIAQAAVVGVPDDRFGEVASAHVVVKQGIELTPEQIVSWSRENMANYKVPRFVRICGELPINAAGKVMRFALKP
jgi:acyl-CoA synthetase (AMP-forming)/AMP-acid ligase II